MVEIETRSISALQLAMLRTRAEYRRAEAAMLAAQDRYNQACEREARAEQVLATDRLLR